MQSGLQIAYAADLAQGVESPGVSGRMTALEALADHLHPQQHPAIGLSKDVAAGAVLVSSVAALVVGMAFFVDQVWPWVSAIQMATVH